MDLLQACENMLKQQIRTSGVEDTTILHLLGTIPRQRFLPPRLESFAYADISLPLSDHEVTQTPQVIAHLLQTLAIKNQDKVLLIGVESGYLAVLLAKLAQSVYVVDGHVDLLHHAAKVAAELGVTNLECHVGGLDYGWEAHAPYDVIVIAGSIPKLPVELTKNLIPNGRIFAIIGNSPVMEAVLVTAMGNDKWQIKHLFETNTPRLPSVQDVPKFVF